MRLYSLTGATAIDDPEYGHFEPDDEGGFALPGELVEKLRGFAIRGKRVWEDDLERQDRIGAEELARRRDPASLYGAIEQLLGLAQKAGAAQAEHAEPADSGTQRTSGRRNAASKKAADDKPAAGTNPDDKQPAADGEPPKTA